MEKDFKVGQSNELLKGDRIYDLHNCFDLKSVVLMGNDAEMTFSPSPVYGQGYSIIKVHIRDIDYFELSASFRTTEIIDFDEVGYKRREDRDDTWLLTENQSTEKDDMFFRFFEGHFVRFHGSSVTLSEI